MPCPREVESEEATVNLTQTSHDRAHTVSVPEVLVQYNAVWVKGGKIHFSADETTI